MCQRPKSEYVNWAVVYFSPFWLEEVNFHEANGWIKDVHLLIFTPNSAGDEGSYTHTKSQRHLEYEAPLLGCPRKSNQASEVVG